MSSKIEELIHLLRSGHKVCAFTGAGISTLAGIRDFRSADGLYNDKTIDANKLFDLEYFQHDPSYYYSHTRNFIYNLEEKQPGLVHLVLAKLESQGIVTSVVTQNIDLLHQKAGSQNVIELHGTPNTHHCLRCGQVSTYGEIVQKLQLEAVPHCDICHGVIKPDIIFFGENLNPSSIDAAINAVTHTDILLILGSSLVVQPAASLPLYTHRAGGKVIVINRESTPLDDLCCLRFTDLEDVFIRLQESF